MPTDPEIALLRQRVDTRVRCVDRPGLLARLERGEVAGLDSAIARSEGLAGARAGELPRPALDADLPITARWQEIAAAIERNAVVVVCGETGSGKTTQLPQICLRAGRGSRGVIGHTQPRRLAARSVAARIAEELGVSLGGAVGVKVRFADQTSERTCVKLMTDGMLLAETSGDRGLTAYDTIIIDEAHERSLNVDFLMGYLRRLVPTRPDLRVVITSATIDPARFAAFFEEGGCGTVPVINVSGRTYPVEVLYRGEGGPREEAPEVDPEAVADAVDELTSPRREKGDVLVFLPGEKEIRQCAEALRRRGSGVEVLPLFARLTNAEQDRIFRWSPQSPRRAILATNVAETSLTVPGIRYVVDTGLARISRYDPRAKVQRLPVEAVSQASAAQRSGRCGRLGPGVCLRLYERKEFDARPAFTEPEIRRTNLASVILQMFALELGRVESFPFLDPPDERAIADGLETLFELGALSAPNGDASITETGRLLARLPLEPRVGRMLLAAEREGSLREVLVLAAGLSVQDPRERPMARAADADAAQEVFRHPTSDFLTLLKLWDQYRHEEDRLSAGPLRDWCRERFVSAVRMREWSETWWQLRGVAEELELRINETPAGEDAIHRALLTGLIANVCCKDEALGPYDYRGFRGNVVSIFPGSVLFKKNPRWIVASEIVETTRLYARTLAKVDPAWVEELAGHVMQRQLSDKHYDAERAEACVWERVAMNGVVVVPRRKTALAPLDPAGARRLFLREGLATGGFGGDAPFAVHNRGVLQRAKRAEAALRRRGVVRTPEDLEPWFQERVPSAVVDGATFEVWRASAEGADARALFLPEDAAITPEGVAGLNAAAYPTQIPMGPECEARAEYRLEPGREDDGLTLRVPLQAFSEEVATRSGWLVPGMLAEKVGVLLRGLPKQHRTHPALQGDGVADELASVMAFGQGSLAGALSETVEVLHGVTIPAPAWPMGSVPIHLRARIVVEDEAGREVGSSRDAHELATRLAGRIAKARSARQRTLFERRGLTAWDFGPLPDHIDLDGRTAYPAVIDEGTTAALTLLPTERAARAATLRGIRRLFACACGEEVSHRLTSTSEWPELVRWYGAFGHEPQLQHELATLVCERCFLTGQGVPATHEEFDARRELMWGRLAQSTMEVVATAAKFLEPRFRVAGRLGSGTSRHWAASVADIREQAAYLMPAGFLAATSWERVREYPRYVEAMRQRLFRLREDGSGAETQLLATLAPHWKRLTGWVARELSRSRAEADADGSTAPGTKASGPKGKAPLPQARRAAPTVNLDAGQWAIVPGNLPVEVEAYRWELEEFRVALFAPELGSRSTERELDRLWKACEGPA